MTFSEEYIVTGTIRDKFPNCLEHLGVVPIPMYFVCYLKYHVSNNFPALNRKHLFFVCENSL